MRDLSVSGSLCLWLSLSVSVSLPLCLFVSVARTSLSLSTHPTAGVCGCPRLAQTASVEHSFPVETLFCFSGQHTPTPTQLHPDRGFDLSANVPPVLACTGSLALSLSVARVSPQASTCTTLPICGPSSIARSTSAPVGGPYGIKTDGVVVAALHVRGGGGGGGGHGTVTSAQSTPCATPSPLVPGTEGPGCASRADYQSTSTNGGVATALDDVMGAGMEDNSMFVSNFPFMVTDDVDTYSMH